MLNMQLTLIDCTRGNNVLSDCMLLNEAIRSRWLNVAPC